VAELGEHVVLFNSILSAVDLVEELQEDENGENVSHVSQLCFSRAIRSCFSGSSVPCVWFQTSYCWSEEDYAHDDHEVPETQTENLPPYCCWQYYLVPVWLTSDNRLLRWLGTEGKSSHGVHDNIDPKELNG